jgi:hypothetical protein
MAVAANLWAVSEELTGAQYHWSVRNKNGE